MRTLKHVLRRRPYTEYSDQQLQKVFKQYMRQEKRGYLMTGCWVFMACCQVLIQQIFDREWTHSILAFGAFFMVALLWFDMTRTIAAYRTSYRTVTTEALEQRISGMRYALRKSLLLGVLGSAICLIWGWRVWNTVVDSSMWYTPIMFWAPWLLYTSKRKAIRFFQEYRQRDLDPPI